MLTQRAKIDDIVLFTRNGHVSRHPQWRARKHVRLFGESCCSKACFWRDLNNNKKNNRRLVHLHTGFMFTILLCIVSLRNAPKFIDVFLYPLTVFSTRALCASRFYIHCPLPTFLFLCFLGGHHGMPAFTAWHVLFALLRMPLLKYGKLSANAIFFLSTLF